MDDQTLNELLTEDEIRRRMSDIAREYPKLRESLKTAYSGLAKAEAEAQLATTFLEVDLFKNPNAKEYLQKAKELGTKLIKEDKLALVALEVEDLQTNYDLAKFECDSSDKYYDKLEKLLSYFQTLMRFTGQTERN